MLDIKKDASQLLAPQVSIQDVFKLLDVSHCHKHMPYLRDTPWLGMERLWPEKHSTLVISPRWGFILVMMTDKVFGA
jgi:hypothetical protein